MRGEWLRSRARVLRYKEEVPLVEEEKRRTTVSLENEALEWDRHEGSVYGRYADDCVLQQGAAAYAAEQAHIRRGLNARFKTLWQMVSYTSIPYSAHADEGSEKDGDRAGQDNTDDEDSDADDFLEGLDLGDNADS